MMSKKIVNTFLIVLACGLWLTVVLKYFSQGKIKINQATPTFKIANKVKFPVNEIEKDFVPSVNNPFVLLGHKSQLEIIESSDSLQSINKSNFTPEPPVTQQPRYLQRARIEYHGTVKHSNQIVYILKINNVLVRLKKGQIFENVTLISGSNNEIEVLNNAKKEIILRL